MKTILLIFHFSFCIFHFAFSQQYGWVKIAGNIPNFPCDTMIINNGEDTVIASLRSLCFINDDEGWLTAVTLDTGVILHTLDGGMSWEIQTLPYVDNLEAIEMINPFEGYAAAREGTIYRTVNGGYTWEYHTTTFAYLLDMDYPPNSDTGYACGDNSATFRITPSGAEDVNPGTVSNLDGISFPVTEKGWTCGGAIINFFENGSWTSLPSLPAGTYDDIFFLDDQHGWVCGTVLGKRINGTDWTECDHYPNVTGSMVRLFFLDDSHGWVICASGQILYTSDSGDNWSSQAEGLTDELLTSVQFTSLTNGYISGNNMTLLKYTLISGEEETWSPGDKESYVVEVFPNPTAGVFSLKSSVVSQGSAAGSQRLAVLEIIDLYGNTLETPSCQLQAANCQLDLSHLPAGIYFIRINLEDQTIVKKVIKI